MDRIVFATTLEGLLLGLGNRVTPTLTTKLNQLGLPGQPRPRGYPIAVWQQAARLLGEGAFPEIPEDEAQFQLGRRLVFGLGETLSGKAAAILSRRLGPRTAALRLPVADYHGCNFGSVKALERSSHEVELRCLDYRFHPAFGRGCYQAAVQVAGGVEVWCEVRADDREAHAVTYRLGWAPV